MFFFNLVCLLVEVVAAGLQLCPWPLGADRIQGRAGLLIKPGKWDEQETGGQVGSRQSLLTAFGRRPTKPRCWREITGHVQGHESQRLLTL